MKKTAAGHQSGRERVAFTPVQDGTGQGTSAPVVAPVNRKKTDKLVAEILENIMTAGCCFAGARLLVTPPDSTPQHPVTPMPYAPCGAARLTEVLHEELYGASLAQLTGPDIAKGCQVDLMLDLPVAAYYMKEDRASMVDWNMDELAGKLISARVSLRVYDANGKRGVAALFGEYNDPQLTRADLDRFGRQTCLVEPNNLSQFLWLLAQAAKIDILESPHCDARQAAIIGGPMKSLALALHADLLRAEGLDTGPLLREGTVSAVEAAHIVARGFWHTASGNTVSGPTISAVEQQLPHITQAAQMFENQMRAAHLLVNICSAEGRDPSRKAKVDTFGQVWLCFIPTRWYGDGHLTRRRDQARIVGDIAFHRNSETDRHLKADRQSAMDVTDLVFHALALLDQPPSALAEIAEMTARLRQTALMYYRFWFVLRQRFAVEFVLDGA